MGGLRIGKEVERHFIGRSRERPCNSKEAIAQNFRIKQMSAFEVQSDNQKDLLCRGCMYGSSS